MMKQRLEVSMTLWTDVTGASRVMASPELGTTHLRNLAGVFLIEIEHVGDLSAPVSP